MHLNWIIREVIRLTSKQFTYVIEYNGNSNTNFDNNVEFIDVDLSCNELNVRLLANDPITYTEKRRIFKTEDKNKKCSKIKAIWEKKILIKRVDKKNSKASVLISAFVNKCFLNIQALFINTNIIIPMLYLFLISPKFWKKTRYLMTVPWKPCKKKIILLAILIIDEEKELYIEIHHFNKNTVETNYSLI